MVCAVISNPSADGMLIEDQEESNMDVEEENYKVELNVDNMILTPHDSQGANEEAKIISYNELFYN